MKNDDPIEKRVRKLEKRFQNHLHFLYNQMIKVKERLKQIEKNG